MTSRRGPDAAAPSPATTRRQDHAGHPRANIQAAIAADSDPGHWYQHHIALPDSPGDFTPYQTPDYAEHDVRPPGEWLEALPELFGPNHAQSIARRGLEAGQ